jgi:hypothetical protein
MLRLLSVAHHCFHGILDRPFETTALFNHLDTCRRLAYGWKAKVIGMLMMCFMVMDL